MTEFDAKWEKLKTEIQVGCVLNGTVFKVSAYGVFVELGYQVEREYMFSGIIDIATRQGDGILPLPSDKDNWPKLNDDTTCKVISFREHRFEVELGLYQESE